MAYATPPRFCRECGQDSREGVRNSYNGYCPRCQEERAARAIIEMAKGSGKIHDKWKRNRRLGMIRELARIERELDESDGKA